MQSFNFDIMPAGFWLSEISGIPFGVPNDMLLHMAVNDRWGMVFGMARRGCAPLWKLWYEFGISGAKMAGFWEKQPLVTTSHEKVLATAYVKEDKVLVALGSWAGETVNVELNIDWEQLGLNPAEVTVVAPEVEGFQKEEVFGIDGEFPVACKGDLLLIILKK